MDTGMRYDLNRLGEYEFEDLTQALALRILGPAVTVFGDGPDGGREASFEGRLRYPDPSPNGVWDGYGVVQAKFRRQPTTTKADTTWFLRQVKAELDAWLDPHRNRVKRGRVPQYILFSTNVALSGDPGRGGIDTIDELIGQCRDQGLPLLGWDVWHQTQLFRYLEIHQDIARKYAGFITPGDVLSALLDRIEGSSTHIGATLGTHAAKELLAQRWVRLGQAGHPDNQRISLGAVAIDLPATPPYQAGARPNLHVADTVSVNVGQHVLAAGDSSRRGGALCVKL